MSSQDTFTPSTPPGPGRQPGQPQQSEQPGHPETAVHPENAEHPMNAEQPVIRDKRRLDPVTGQVRQPGPAADAPGAAGVDADGAAATPAVEPEASGVPDAAAELAAAQALAEERLGDVQRLQAEYVNYRRRVDRDRDVAREAGKVSVLEALLPVLDDVHLARQHGDLAGGPFAAIAEKLEAALLRAGLERYGESGQEFDPAVHEALMHESASDVSVTTVTAVLQPGYRTGGRVLRPARVAVVSPA